MDTDNFVEAVETPSSAVMKLAKSYANSPIGKGTVKGLSYALRRNEESGRNLKALQKEYTRTKSKGYAVWVADKSLAYIKQISWNFRKELKDAGVTCTFVTPNKDSLNKGYAVIARYEISDIGKNNKAMSIITKLHNLLSKSFEKFTSKPILKRTDENEYAILVNLDATLFCKYLEPLITKRGGNIMDKANEANIIDINRNKNNIPEINVSNYKKDRIRQREEMIRTRRISENDVPEDIRKAAASGTQNKTLKLLSDPETIAKFKRSNINRSNESVSSVLRRDEEKRQEKEDNKNDNFIDLSSLYRLYINEDAIKKYEDEYAQLSHIDKNANKLRGYMYFMNSRGKKGDLVAFISVKLESGKTWIDTLEVTPDYRGNKISHQLLDVACQEFGATDIRVNKNNERAIKIFQKYGFIEYDRKNQWIYMSNDSATTSNPLHKHEADKDQEKGTAKESYDPATEAIFGKPSKEKLIDGAMKKISKKINTEEERKAFLTHITDNEKTYKAALTSINKLDRKMDKGVISVKEYEKQRKLAYGVMKKAMIEFNVNINNIIDNAKKPTSEEYATILSIISEIKTNVKKMKLTKASESCDYDDLSKMDLDSVVESLYSSDYDEFDRLVDEAIESTKYDNDGCY